MILFDTNVLLDIATADPVWLPWSEKEFRAAAAQRPIPINPIIYAELAPAFASAADLDLWLDSEVFQRLPLPYAAGWVAAQAFLKYRRGGGIRTSPLPGFYKRNDDGIKAHRLARARAPTNQQVRHSAKVREQRMAREINPQHDRNAASGLPPLVGPEKVPQTDFSPDRIRYVDLKLREGPLEPVRRGRECRTRVGRFGRRFSQPEQIEARQVIVCDVWRNFTGDCIRPPSLGGCLMHLPFPGRAWI